VTEEVDLVGDSEFGSPSAQLAKEAVVPERRGPRELEPGVASGEGVGEGVEQQPLSLPWVDAGEHADAEPARRSWGRATAAKAGGTRDHAGDGVRAQVRQRRLERRSRVTHDPVGPRQHDARHDGVAEPTERLMMDHVAHVHDEGDAGRPRRETAVRRRARGVRVDDIGSPEARMDARGSGLRQQPRRGDDLEREPARTGPGRLPHADDAMRRARGQVIEDAEAGIVGRGQHDERRPRRARLEHAQERELRTAGHRRVLEVEDS
jgi:hypothetical protein